MSASSQSGTRVANVNDAHELFKIHARHDTDIQKPSKSTHTHTYTRSHTHTHTQTLMPASTLTLTLVLQHLRVPKVGVGSSFSQLNRSQRSSGKFINDKLLMRKMDNADEDVDTDDASSRRVECADKHNNNYKINKL